ncbi:MAG: LysM peptidoglycan-binding domain-containing protein, partial [Odoribacter sp.]|nr:LysM peptidoglycan-binding domain-containing protein [Odoribacter sp.]
MFRLILGIWLVCLGLGAVAQHIEVKKSSDIVVLRGKSYYLHTVQSGQTLFSICKAYGTNVEEVKALNGKQDNVLSLYEVLKIPYVEPFVQQDGKYYYHKVRQGETVYSVARHYRIAPKRLLKFNSGYANNPLSVGAVLKLPLNEITLPEWNREPDNHVSRHSRRENTDDSGTGHIVIAENTGAVHQDTLPVLPGSVLQQTWDTIPAYLSEWVVPVDSFVKIALLLPLSAGDYPVYQDSLSAFQPVNLSARAEMFIGFYEGVLLAVDSLKSLGYRIELHVFDTERSNERIQLIADEINRLQPDLILGPIYASLYRGMAERLDNKNIPLIYPLSSRSEDFGKYPNFIQVSASFDVLAGQMLGWLGRKRADANIVYINLLGLEDAEVEEKRCFGRQVAALDGVYEFGWDMDQIPLDSLRMLLLPDRENIIVLPVAKEAEVSKVLPLLSALTDGYRITVLGLPEWQTFTSVDHETYYKLNTKLFTYS